MTVRLNHSPAIVHVIPPDEHAYLWAAWPGGPVLGGEIAAWPLRTAPAGPFPAGTGTISGPFNGICMTLAADGTTVVARQCGPGVSSQMWTGYSDGTLRIHPLARRLPPLFDRRLTNAAWRLPERAPHSGRPQVVTKGAETGS